MKKVFIYSHVQLWEIHHLEIAELALKHHAQGDKVLLLSCMEALNSCPVNPKHDLFVCRQCKAQTNYTNKNILKGKVDHFRLKIKEVAHNFPAFNDIDELRAYHYEDLPAGRLVLSQITTDMRDCCITFNEIAERAYSLLENCIGLYQSSIKFMQKHQPDLAYVWNGRRCSDGPVAYAAQKLGIPVIAHIIDGSEDRLFLAHNVGIHSLDYNTRLLESLSNELLADGKKDLLIENAKIFFKANRFGGDHTLGYIQFSKQFDENAVKFEKTKEKTMVIFPSSFWEYYSMPDYLHASDEYVNHYDALALVLNDEYVNAHFNIIVRWHPNLKTCGKAERERIDKLIASTQHATHFDPESTVNSYKLIEQSDIVITFGSTIGIEAAYYGKPSILLGRSLYEKTGSVHVPANHEAFINLLKSEIKALDPLGAMKYAYFVRNRAQYHVQYFKQGEDKGWYYNGKRLKNEFKQGPLSVFSRAWGRLERTYKKNTRRLLR